MKANAAYQGMDHSEKLVNRMSAYLALTKPTISLLVIVTTLPAILLSHPLGTTVELSLVLATLFGTFLASASAATFNQLVEVHVDSHMKRTRSRGMACGRISRLNGALFGTLLGASGLAILYWQVNALAATIALIGHTFYVLIYTMYLKPRTAQNIVIGGAAGAVGPLIGWAAGASTLALPAWILFAIIVAWTPPHFWALAMKYKNDYAQANIPMYPVLYGDQKTKRMMVLYTIALIPLVLSLYFISEAGLFYLAISGVLTAKFMIDSVRLYNDATNKNLMPYFYFSCTYALGVFAALAGDWFIRGAFNA